MSKTNEALAKAAEEATKGLAQHEPLEVIPMTKAHVGSALRAGSYRQLLKDLEALSPMHLSIPAKIYECFAFYGGLQARCKTAQIEKIPAGRYEDHAVLAEALKQEYHHWIATVPLHYRTVAVDVICLGESFEAIGNAKGRSKNTMRAWAVKAIDGWVRILPERVKAKRKPAIGERDRSDFVVSKVVVFEDV